MIDGMSPPHSVTRSDGIVFKKGEWIEIDRGVGRFMGVWNNPTLGLTSGLSFFRLFERPDQITSIYFMHGELNGEAKRTALDAAFKVSGPLRRDGKRPRRI